MRSILFSFPLFSFFHLFLSSIWSFSSTRKACLCDCLYTGPYDGKCARCVVLPLLWIFFIICAVLFSPYIIIGLIGMCIYLTSSLSLLFLFFFYFIYFYFINFIFIFIFIFIFLYLFIYFF